QPAIPLTSPRHDRCRFSPTRFLATHPRPPRSPLFPYTTLFRSTESERNARETVNSFRRLALEEIQTARPLRIKVITVQPGDTVESLSHRMAGVDRPAERFRVLNGLDPRAQVKVRDLVKIVVD